jgi:hypothetical protein
MPVVVGSVRDGIEGDHAGRLRVIFPIEEHQLRARSSAGEEAEVDAAVPNSCAEGNTAPGYLKDHVLAPRLAVK